jgi:hypothetical protein
MSRAVNFELNAGEVRLVANGKILNLAALPLIRHIMDVISGLTKHVDV